MIRRGVPAAVAINRFRPIVQMLAWMALSLIAVVTLSPIGLRPEMSTPNIERFGAYFLAGLLFGLAYPQRVRTVIFLIVGAALTLEIFQTFTLDRHGHISDSVVKVAGGIAGLVLAIVGERLLRKPS